MVIMGYQDVETNFKLAYFQNKNKYLIGIVPRKGKWSFVNKYLTRVSTGKSFIFLPAWRLKLGEFGSKRQSQTGRSYFLHGSVERWIRSQGPGPWAVRRAQAASGYFDKLSIIWPSPWSWGLGLGQVQTSDRPSQAIVPILTTRGATVLACCLVAHWPTQLC